MSFLAIGIPITDLVVVGVFVYVNNEILYKLLKNGEIRWENSLNLY